jgi:hypothetical protein
MPAQTYYAVFDGHNGEAAAVYASVHLLTNIVRSSAFQTDLEAAIKEGVKRTDEDFCKTVRVWSTIPRVFPFPASSIFYHQPFHSPSSFASPLLSFLIGGT